MFCILECFQTNVNVDVSNKKHQHPTKESLHGSITLAQPQLFDVWIVLGIKSCTSSNAHLVNARWKSNLSKKWHQDEHTRTFFKDLLDNIPHGGLEISRKGGSGGLPTYKDDNILKLLASTTAFPRKGKAIKLVKLQKVWRCYYLRALKSHNQFRLVRSFTKYDYSQPQVGGQLELDFFLLKNYGEIIFSMTTAKYNTALLMQKLSSTLEVIIQKDAVDNSLSQIKSMKEYQKNLLISDNKFYKKVGIDQCKHMLTLLSLENKFSLVAYPVCYHYDVFKEKAASLENKICFSFESKNEYDCGRHGDGKGRFVFAFLDWQNNSSGTRRRRFIAANGELRNGQRVSSERLVQRFGPHWNHELN